MTIHLGYIKASTTIYIPFNTYDSVGASVTISNFAVGDIAIYKNGGTTQRTSTNGFTLLDTDGIDFDGLTGIHGFSIDLSDNTDAGFYAAGNWYWVVVHPFTADTRTVGFVAATFIIGPVQADVTQYNGTAGTFASGRPEVNMTHIAGSAVSTSTAQLGVNAVQAGGTAWGSGAITAASIASDAITAAKVASDVSTEINSAVLAVLPAALTADGNIKADTLRVGGTLQTARDIGASVLLSSGTGTGQLDFTSGVVKSNLAQILGTALTETAGQIAAAFKKFFDKAAPTGTINSIPDAVAGASGGLFIAGSNAATTANITGNLTGNVSGSVGSVATGGIAAASFAAGAIDAAAIAADAIGASELAADAATEIAAAVTSALGTGTALTAIPWNASWDAEVQSEVDDALVAQRLDELLNADSDIDGAQPPTVGSVFHEALTKTPGSFTYDQTTDSPEALRDNIGTNGAALSLAKTTNITGFNDLSAAQVNAEADTALSDVGLTTTITGRIDRAISAIFTTAMTESYNTDGSAATPAQALYLIMQRLTEFSISGTTITAKKLDGSTTAFTLTIDSATTPTSSTRAT